jgi:hypothetical protein
MRNKPNSAAQTIEHQESNMKKQTQSTHNTIRTPQNARSTTRKNEPNVSDTLSFPRRRESTQKMLLAIHEDMQNIISDR